MRAGSRGSARLLDLRVAVCNDSIQPDFVKVRGLQLEHLVDTLPVDFVSSRTHFLRGAVGASKSSLDQLLTVLVQQLKGLQVRACRYLDQLGKPISDLRHGQGAQEREIEEGMYRGMIGPQTVLVISVVDGNFDGNRGVYQANYRRRDADEIRVSTVRRAGKPTSDAG